MVGLDRSLVLTCSDALTKSLVSVLAAPDLAVVDEEQLLGRIVQTRQLGLLAVLLDPSLVSLEALSDSSVVG